MLPLTSPEPFLSQRFPAAKLIDEERPEILDTIQRNFDKGASQYQQ
jgi:hypothetical protein